MDYNPQEIEKKWQAFWQENEIYKVNNQSDKPKFYTLDMFPYPSGAGLHVGHPLGYIATDIIARFKRMQGHNVLHPMGFDSFGLPAEQYAIETGQHPAITTAQNIKTFKSQLAKLGFDYDWSREVQTSSPDYYQWTQWIFQQIFDSWYNKKTDKAEHIGSLIAEFEQNGNNHIQAECDEDTPQFTAQEWNSFSETEQAALLLKYRLTYVADSVVNWCPALGTVLANDEIKDGFSERGGHPVERKKMRQWMMRITAYSEKLLQGLEEIDWSEAVKEMQRNWIGKSFGAEVEFAVFDPSSSIYPTPSPSPQGEGGFERGTLSTSNLKDMPYLTTDAGRWNYLKEFARKNRKNPTEAENVLWQAVRKNKLGFKIRRQHAIDDFIVDFVSLEKQLVIEIDGGIHEEPEQKEYDTIRTQILNTLGFEVIRFTNEEVTQQLASVLEKIKVKLSSSEFSSSDEKNPPSLEGRGLGGGVLKVFTTRPDTIYGVTFMVIAPELDLVPALTTPEQKETVEKYVSWAKNRSERERQAEVKTVSGVFTGSYAINPFTEEKIPIWITDYVLAGYGTGVVMAVPSSDDRDFRFATQFNLPIRCVIAGTEELENPTEVKHGKLINSGFLDGLDTQDAIQKIIQEIEKRGIGKGKINYRLRDAVFSRQRYWGEPVPVYFKEAIPYLVPQKALPLGLPEIDEYRPTAEGEPPLGRAEAWKYEGKYEYELTTMPGWAGSSWYFLRYMDAQNKEEFASKQATDYWGQVDLYIGGTEHAVGHLLYSRFWTHFLHDRGFIAHREPFKKLINQGMIQGTSALVYRVKDQNAFVSADLAKDYETTELHADVSLVENDVLNIESFKQWRPETADYTFISNADGKFLCGSRVEKMSKRWYNVVNPDDVVARYGADTMRLYEMFLGPLEQSKPWDPKNIDGSFRFLRKLWRLFFNEQQSLDISNDTPNKAELKALHRTIKKVQEDLDRYSFNTVVSEFMKCVNELSSLKCNKIAILNPLLRMMAPYIPHITEELWAKLGHINSIHLEEFPAFDEQYLVEDAFPYPIMVNGKKRHLMEFAADMSEEAIKAEVLADATVQRWLEGKNPKKMIVVPKKIVNIVV